MGARNLNELLDRAVARHGDRPALIHGDEVWTYDELACAVRCVASSLQAQRVQKGDCVPVFGPKSPWSVAFMLAALQLGAVYAPLEFGLPPPLLQQILRDSGARLMCVTAPEHPRVRLALHGSSLQVIGPGVAAAEPVLPVEVVADDLAYVLFTSGSTGVPKGIAHTHASALAFVEWAVEHVGAGANDVFASHASFSFDLSVFDLYGAICVAAPLVLLSETELRFPGDVARLIERHRISVWYSVPSALVQLMAVGAHPVLNQLRVVIFAGEVFPQDRLRELLARAPSPRYCNFFGPTETNVCTYWDVDQRLLEVAAAIPIGWQCPYCTVELVAEDGSSSRQSGEMVVSGANVTSGYWRAGELDRRADDRLLSSAEPNGRRFRTGDFASIDGEGLMWFHGRRDRQVKVRGFRIELDSVEASLRSMPDIDDALVVGFKGSSGLCIGAAVQVLPAHTSQERDLLRKAAGWLRPQELPDRILVLSELPRNARGKFDYAAIVARFEERDRGQTQH